MGKTQYFQKDVPKHVGIGRTRLPSCYDDEILEQCNGRCRLTISYAKNVQNIDMGIIDRVTLCILNVTILMSDRKFELSVFVC